MKNNRRLILIALFIAISYIGALLKLPGPISTVALDSFAGYLGGLILGATYGGFVGMAAHLFVSMTSGFPLSMPVHIIISIMMFISIFCYSKVAKRYNLILASVVGIIINGVLMPLALMVFVPILPAFMDKVFLISLIPILVIASVTNIILSNVIYASIKNLIPLWVNE